MSELTPFYGKSILEEKKFSVLDMSSLANTIKNLEIENAQHKDVIEDLLEAVINGIETCAKCGLGGKVGHDPRCQIKAAIQKAQELKGLCPTKEEMLDLAKELEGNYFLERNEISDIASGIAMLLRAKAEEWEKKQK